MQSIDLQDLPPLPEQIVLDIKGKDGCAKKVGILGLLSADPGLYRYSGWLSHENLWLPRLCLCTRQIIAEQCQDPRVGRKTTWLLVGRRK